MKEKKYTLNSLIVVTLLVLFGCNNQPQEKVAHHAPMTTTTQSTEKITTPTRGPIINIADTLSLKRYVLTMRDSAATFSRISLKLGEIYGVKLNKTIEKQHLKITGAPMAWYKRQKAPYFFEAGLPVNKKPTKLPKGVYLKEIGVDSIVVAHFYGPYELIPQAYDALEEWLKDHKKKQKGAPYEIYVDDPIDKDGKAKDPYKVRTDIIFSWK